MYFQFHPPSLIKISYGAASLETENVKAKHVDPGKVGDDGESLMFFRNSGACFCFAVFNSC